MLPAEASAIVAKQILESCLQAATISGAFTGMPYAQGDIVVLVDIGTLTGSIVGVLYTASDAAGTGKTAMTDVDGSGSYPAVSTSSHIIKKVFDARQNLGYIGYVGTITTGPVNISVSAVYRPHWTS